MKWKSLVFHFPGTSGMSDVEQIELQKGKLLSMKKAGGGLVPHETEPNGYIFANSRFDSVGFAEGKITWAFFLAEFLLVILSWWFARRQQAESWQTLMPSAIAVTLALTLLTQVALPLQSYWANRTSYPFSLVSLGGAIAWRFIWMSPLSFVVVLVLSKCFGRWVFGAVFAMSVCVYLESGILSNGLASLNGDVFLLQDRTRTLWDAAAWMAVFATFLALHAILKKYYVQASLCLALLAGASLFDVKHEKLADKTNLIVHNFTPIDTVIRNVVYSTNRNVLVFILDSLEREQAHAIMEDSEAGPGLREQFRGFTEFTDNVGAFPETLLSVPNLLTGLYPNETNSFANYTWSCYGSESVLRDYLQAGYDLFVTTPALGCGYTSRTNATMAVSGHDSSVFDIPGNGGDTWSIRNFTRWRWMPFGAKAIVSDLTSRFINTPGGDFHEWSVYPVLAKAKIATSGIGMFLWLHTSGVHVPVSWNRRGEILPVEDSSDRGCIEQGVFIMEKLGDLLDFYRKAGVYDKSLVLVLGDHGRHSEQTLIQDKNAGRLPGNARPCLWIKPVGSTHEFRSDASSTSHAQVAELLRAAALKDLSEADIASILRLDKRIYRQMAGLGNAWTDWVVDKNGTFTIEEHQGGVASRDHVQPLSCGHRYSLAWDQVRNSDVDVGFVNMGGGTEYPFLPRETANASIEFRVPNAERKYALRLELYLCQGGSLRFRCDVPNVAWAEFPVQSHGKITVHGIQADSSGVARVLIERSSGPHVDVSFTSLLLMEDR